LHGSAPVRLLPLLAFVLIGVSGALGAYTFAYARGWAYLTNDPAACANCHVMQEQFSGWIKGSHRSVAVCNDCHTPPGLIPKYLVKAENGFRHSFAFTTGRFPDQIRIVPSDLAVTEKACRKCHAEIVTAIEGPAGTEQLSCVRCHRSVGHLE
jgi:cytochrome c nitrite reductase small subunit